MRIRRDRIHTNGVNTPWRPCDFEGLLDDMEANSSSREQDDSVLIPESTLEAFLGASSTDLSLEASQLANENGWTATRTPDGHWQFEREGS